MSVISITSPQLIQNFMSVLQEKNVETETFPVQKAIAVAIYHSKLLLTTHKKGLNSLCLQIILHLDSLLNNESHDIRELAARCLCEQLFKMTTVPDIQLIKRKLFEFLLQKDEKMDKELYSVLLEKIYQPKVYHFKQLLQKEQQAATILFASEAPNPYFEYATQLTFYESILFKNCFLLENDKLKEIQAYVLDELSYFVLDSQKMGWFSGNRFIFQHFLNLIVLAQLLLQFNTTSLMKEIKDSLQMLKNIPFLHPFLRNKLIFVIDQ
jgi:hypothetical protein